LKKKQSYRIHNWKEYNKALVNRGSITFWFDEESIEQWHATEMTAKRGRPLLYSGLSILCALTIKNIYCLPLRATEGLVTSLVELMELPIQCPNYTTLCKRQKQLAIALPKTQKKTKANPCISWWIHQDLKCTVKKNGKYANMAPVNGEPSVNCI
jgi:Transposase DDE domain